MEHFYQRIQGWFDFQNIYSNAVSTAPTEGAHFVEIGSWKGTSAAYMAVEIANSRKKFGSTVLIRGVERQMSMTQTHTLSMTHFIVTSPRI